MTPEETYRQATLRGIPMLWLMQDRPVNRPTRAYRTRSAIGGYLLALLISLALAWLLT